MLNPRTEKAIKRLMDYLKLDPTGAGVFCERKINHKTGDMKFTFEDPFRKKIATFTLSQLIAKRGPKRKKKKA